MKSGENWSSSFIEKKTFKDFMILYIYIAKGQGKITPRGQNIDFN